jgi:hypothetical protein
MAELPHAGILVVLGQAVGWLNSTGEAVRLGLPAQLSIPAPVLSGVAAGEAQNHLDWSWAETRFLDQGYEIERSFDGGPFVALITTAQGVFSHDDPDLAPGLYAYRVRALTPYGPSAYSNIVEILLSPADVGRHWKDQVMISLFAREASYDAGVSVSAATTCSMRDFDDATPHEEWDDLVDDDVPLVHGEEYRVVQALVRQSVRLTYREPRTKPNTLAGLIGLALGSITSVRDGTAGAWRHRLSKAASVQMPSVTLQTRHAMGGQYRYTGIKADGFTLAANGPYLSLSAPLIGSGSRTRAADSFPPAVDERWLRWGDAHVYWVAAPTPIALPADPVQGATNLGPEATEISTRLIGQFEIVHGTHLLDEMGYRPGSGRVRAHLHPERRETWVIVELAVDVDLEATEIDRYFHQTPTALELNVDSGVLIDPSGTYRYGFILLIPRLQWRRVRYDEEHQLETLVLEGQVLADGTNPEIVCWVFNAQPRYLE